MTSPREATAFAPATVGNVICGFDVLGLALERPGDRVTARAVDEPGARIVKIHGIVQNLPTDPARNSAGAAVAALLEKHAPAAGVELELEKGLPLSAGMGGSAASAVAATVAANSVLGTNASPQELMEYALQGEAVAAGQAHGDNVAPSLLGGLVLVRPSGRHRILPLPVPPELSVALLHPHLELATREARAALGETVTLEATVEQMGHLAAFVHALHEGDLDLLQDSLVDRIAEPHRGPAIPGLDAVRRAALDAGALACGISGAGPSLFALCTDASTAEEVGMAMKTAFSTASPLAADLHLSPVSRAGARLVPSETPTNATSEAST